jgi:hypothetical protein
MLIRLSLFRIGMNRYIASGSMTANIGFVAFASTTPTIADTRIANIGLEFMIQILQSSPFCNRQSNNFQLQHQQP